ncbi:uncharacterized protein TNCV_4769501 [Trichonephila clavipes]|nr:uncharacterized protein TNCV_4769501 [Trichonephila clavipes]
MSNFLKQPVGARQLGGQDGWRTTASILVPLRTPSKRGPMHVKSVEAQTSSRLCDGKVRRRSVVVCSAFVPNATCLALSGDHDNLVVKVSDHGWLITSSSPVPLKTRRIGERCMLNLSRAETSSRWCGVVARRGCRLRCHPRHLAMVQNDEVRRQMPSCSRIVRRTVGSFPNLEIILWLSSLHNYI